MDLSSLKVMVVDDSKTIRRTAETLLKKEGCQVFTAEDGFDALAKIADSSPDIIFVDRPPSSCYLVRMDCLIKPKDELLALTIT
jgi:CheY-like chemotaxis protein